MAKSLFHRAIINSGAAVGPWAPANISIGLDSSARYMSAVGAKTVDDLRRMDLHTLMVGNGNGTGVWEGIVAVDGAVMTQNVDVAWSTGDLNMDALVIGVDTADGLVEYPYTALYTGYTVLVLSIL